MSEALVEQILRGVLTELAKSSRGGVERGSAASNPQPERTVAIAPVVTAPAALPQADATIGLLRLDEKVVTYDVLRERVRNEKSVGIAPGTVLTPSAREFLRQRGMQCVISDAKSDRPAAAWQCVVQTTSSVVAKALEDVGQSARLKLETANVSDSVTAAATVISVLERGAAVGVIVLTNRGPVIACRVNRRTNIRAAVLNDSLLIKPFQEHLGPNVWCIDPTGRSYFELRKILLAVTQVAPRPPADWHESN